jgi:hypothetical protein
MSDFGIIYLVIRDFISSLVGSVLGYFSTPEKFVQSPKVPLFCQFSSSIFFIALYTVITGMTGQ